MSQLLHDKVIFISGSTRGIGWQAAQLLAENGAKVIINGCKNEEEVHQKTLILKESYNCDALGLFADFKDPLKIQSCYQQIFKKYGTLDVVVNNAGIMKPALLGMIPHDLIEESFNLNALSIIYSMQAAAKLMRRKKSGSIINISSLLGITGASGQVVYAGTKAAVIGMTKSAAKELGPDNIRVNAIAPGFIETDLTQNQPKNIIEQVALKRLGTPQDVAKAILFLASPLSSYMTGQVLGVDGGLIV